MVAKVANITTTSNIKFAGTYTSAVTGFSWEIYRKGLKLFAVNVETGFTCYMNLRATKVAQQEYALRDAMQQLAEKTFKLEQQLIEAREEAAYYKKQCDIMWNVFTNHLASVGL